MYDSFYERVVIILDPTCDGREAIATGGALAARWRIGLHLTFVLDPNLVRLTELPFVREHTLFSTEPRALDRASLESQLRAYSNRAAADLAKAARSHRLRSHFRILEGVPSPEVLGLGERDFVILCGSARPFMHFSAQSSHWEEFAKHLAQGRLLLRGGMRQPGAVIAIVDEQPRAEEEIARDIAATISTGPGPDHPIVLIQLNELDRELSRRSCGLLISGRAAESSSALIEKTKVAPPIDLMLL